MQQIIYLLVILQIFMSCDVKNKSVEKVKISNSLIETVSVDGDFGRFLDVFDFKPLPIVHDEQFLLDYYPQNDRIENSLLKRFISENKVINNKFKTFDLFRYYPLQKSSCIYV